MSKLLPSLLFVSSLPGGLWNNLPTHCTVRRSNPTPFTHNNYAPAFTATSSSPSIWPLQSTSCFISHKRARMSTHNLAICAHSSLNTSSQALFVWSSLHSQQRNSHARAGNIFLASFSTILIIIICGCWCESVATMPRRDLLVAWANFVFYSSSSTTMSRH